MEYGEHKHQHAWWEESECLVEADGWQREGQ